MTRLRSFALAPLAAAFLLTSLTSGCAVQGAGEDPSTDEPTAEYEGEVGALAFAGAGVGAIGAAGTAIVCNVVCITVGVVAVVGTTVTFVYLNSRDRNQVPASSIQRYRFNLDWTYAGATCPAVSANALSFLSQRYTTCLKYGGGLDACRARTYDEALSVQSCERANGGRACATDAYLASTTKTSDGTGTNVGVVAGVTDSTNCVANRHFAPERTDNSSGCTANDGSTRCYSARHHPCDGVHTHGKLYENQWRGTRCVRREVKAVRCDGSFFSSGRCSGPTVACGAGGPFTSGIHEYK